MHNGIFDCLSVWEWIQSAQCNLDLYIISGLQQKITTLNYSLLQPADAYNIPEFES